jgi:hypothetical protein
MLVSKNVNANLVQGLAVTLEQYIAAYAMSDFVDKDKAFNKYYNYKIKGGKIYQESDSNWFDIDPATRHILEEQDALSEVMVDQYGKPYTNIPSPGPKKTKAPGKPKGQMIKTAGMDLEKPTDIVKQTNAAIEKEIAAAKQGKDAQTQKSLKPGFKSVSVSQSSISLQPTWITVEKHGGGQTRLGVKVVPMMIEGFNIKHTISQDMHKYFIHTILAGIGRKLMRIMYRKIDKYFHHAPRGDVRHDLFYARTGHDGQPFILLDKNEDIPKVFFTNPRTMLKLWRLSWGNLIIADDNTKTVMFCMKKYRGMCSNLTYAMIFAQDRQMAKVFDDMEDARKAAGSLFKLNKKITTLGGRR